MTLLMLMLDQRYMLLDAGCSTMTNAGCWMLCWMLDQLILYWNAHGWTTLNTPKSGQLLLSPSLSQPRPASTSVKSREDVTVKLSVTV